MNRYAGSPSVACQLLMADRCRPEPPAWRTEPGPNPGRAPHRQDIGPGSARPLSTRLGLAHGLRPEPLSSSSKNAPAPKRKGNGGALPSKKRSKTNRVESDDEEDDVADRPPSESDMSDEGEAESDEEDSDDEELSLHDWLKKNAKRTKATGPYLPFHRAAQWVMRTQYSFVEWHRMWTIFRWDRKGAFYDYQTDEKITQEKFEDIYCLELKLLHVLEGLVDDFDEAISSLRTASFTKLAQKMNTSASTARGDDLSSLKCIGMNYVLREFAWWYKDNPWAKPVDPIGRKEICRGPRDPLTLYLLLPPAMTEEFVDNWETSWEDFGDKVIKGKIKITGDELPRVLWSKLNFDPDDIQHGLLYSPILVMFWKHIFLSPSHALDKDPKPVSKTCQAGMHGMEAVTANSICYAAMILHYTLTDLISWKRREHFKPEALWKNIASLFHGDIHKYEIDPMDVDTEWTESVLSAWNNACFGTIDEDADYVEPVVTSTYELVRQQRIAKQQRLAEEARRAGQGENDSDPVPSSSRVSSPAPVTEGSSDDLEDLANHGKSAGRSLSTP
ncbi:hypothetical protein NMY22_g13260 [Coprinellus aureogranulatus]|nr:hypothetical protein NMY22_g13260 [Coprinellus aureogranulatus]